MVGSERVRRHPHPRDWPMQPFCMWPRMSRCPLALPFLPCAKSVETRVQSHSTSHFRVRCRPPPTTYCALTIPVLLRKCEIGAFLTHSLTHSHLRQHIRELIQWVTIPISGLKSRKAPSLQHPFPLTFNVFLIDKLFLMPYTLLTHFTHITRVHGGTYDEGAARPVGGQIACVPP
jgi:hypothetical protein